MPTIEQLEKINTLSKDILNLSRNTLIVNLRFMDSALGRLSLVPSEVETTSTDGENYYYNPIAVLKNYKLANELPCRQYLHTIFHCIYRHMFIGTLVDKRLWNLACDIAVENTINELDLTNTSTAIETAQQAKITALKNNVKYITAEVIYRYFLDSNITENELSDLEEIFSQDDHSIWSNRNTSNEKTVLSYKNSNNRSSNKNSGQSDNSKEDFNQQKNGTDSKALEEMWKDVSEVIETALETFEKRRGITAGGLTQNLLEVNRERYDYTAFLKKFAVMGEAMKINDDEFDYIFYTYGFNMYGKMPLIEPLEYKDIKRIKEFVIAIDTSGSVHGELVQRFVQKTYNILKSSESFFTKINLHIIQCDSEIQSDVKITTQKEFDCYIKNMKLHGFGGTNFRPVFSYVNSLIENHEFTNLKGLIYFTDGFGTFPERQPDYNTAFVFVNDGYENPQVPVWAIKLVLQPEEI